MAKLSRRDFLKITVTTSVGILAASCASPTPEPAAPATATKAPAAAATNTPEPVSKYKEAPMLADMVAAGDLPPVDERLPKNPWVCAVQDGIGNYGGIWRLGKRGQADTYSAGQVTERGLLKIDALDISPEMLHICKQKLRQDGLSATLFEDDIVKFQTNKKYEDQSISFGSLFEYQIVIA